jgi:hypothetical protein
VKNLCLTALGIVSFLGTMATPASAVGGIVTPSSVMPGGSVTVTGTVPVPGCPVPGNVILQGISVWANPSGFVAVPYDAAGRFSASGRLSSTITLGPQGFLIRCAARNEPLGSGAGAEIGGPAADANFTVVGLAVVGLARTGGSVGPLSDTATAAFALALIAFGSAAMLTGPRRRWLDGSGGQDA